MNKYYIATHVHSDGSLLDGLSQVHQIVERCKEIGSPAISLSDHGSLSNSISFLKECKKESIKPILGEEFYCSEKPANIRDNDNREHSHLLIYANNDNGWKTLLKIHNKASEPENFYYRPRLSIGEVANLTDGNISIIIGHIGSKLANLILQDDYQAAKSLIFFLCDKFGKENVWLEAQSVGVHCIPETRKILAIIRRLSDELNIPAVATPDAHYCKRENKILQNILLCKGLGGITLEELKNSGMSTFATSDDWFIPTYDEMKNHYGSTEQELENTIIFADRISEYKNILRSPMLPNFKCPENHTATTWLRELCRNGWRNKIQNVVPKNEQQVYVDRIKHELQVFEEANLAGYFLIVEDIIRYATEQLKCIKSPGRGCLNNSDIFLSDGSIKDISELSIGDSIIDKNGDIKYIENKFEYNIENEELLNIKTFFGDYKGITLTKDHKILAIKRDKKYRKGKKNKIAYYFDKNKIPEWIESEKLEVGDYIYYPIPKKDEKEYIFDLSQYCFNKNNGSKAYLINNNEMIFYKIGNRYSLSKKIKFNRYLRLNKQFAYILGLYTGDGWVNSQKGNNDTNFCFNSITNKKQQKFTIKFMESIGCNTKYTLNVNRKNVNQIHFGNIVINKLFRDLFPNYSYKPESKSIPQQIFNCKNNIKLAYLLGVIHSDGYIENGKITICSVSKKLIYQLKFLCLQLGLPSGVKTEKRIDKREEFKNRKQAYYLTIPNFLKKNKRVFIKRDNYILCPIRKINKIDKIEKVYDIKIEGNEHNYLTTNGLVHNSVGGCLTAYLLNITQVDPIKYNLLFSRFYDESRKETLPDIDMDFPKHKREQIIQYIKDKYGKDHVAQIATYQTMKGRAALKDVFRAYGNISVDEQNRLTKHLPDPAKIAGELQEMEEEEGESSLIRYTLENDKQGKLREWCWIDNEPYEKNIDLKDPNILENQFVQQSLKGPLAKQFEQAIQLEGTKVAQSKHAAGVVISPTPLNEICPLTYDTKTKSQICSLSLEDADSIGLVKIDILGIINLDKLTDISKIVAENEAC